jgi:hypothetical protein
MATHDGIALPHRDRRRSAGVPTGGARAPGDPRHTVVAEASCAAEALAAVERLAPDAGLLDSGSVRRAAMTSRGALNRLDAAPDLFRRRRLGASDIVSSGAHPIRAMR